MPVHILLSIHRLVYSVLLYLFLTNTYLYISDIRHVGTLDFSVHYDGVLSGRISMQMDIREEHSQAGHSLSLKGLVYDRALGGAQYQRSDASLLPKLLSASCTVREGEDDPHTRPCLPRHPEVLSTIRCL